MIGRLLSRVRRAEGWQGLAKRILNPAFLLRKISERRRMMRELREASAAGAECSQWLASGSKTPKISVLMPVFCPPAEFFERAVASVRAQTYPHWELCLSDDASGDEGLRAQMDAWAREDSRIRCVFRAERGHISANSNSALALATGEYVALLDQDDLLTPDALFRVAKSIGESGAPDYLYSDECKIRDDEPYDPTFKSKWDPEALLQKMYTGHLSVFRAEIMRVVGGFRVGFEGAQDHDLALRVTERSGPVVHIARILYLWRDHAGSTARGPGEKKYASEAGRRVRAEALSRRGATR